MLVYFSILVNAIDCESGILRYSAHVGEALDIQMLQACLVQFDRKVLETRLCPCWASRIYLWNGEIFSFVVKRTSFYEEGRIDIWLAGFVKLD